MSWVVVPWTVEFTVVVFGVEVGSNSGADSGEVVNVLEVGSVLVEVILEMLNHVHLVGDEVVVSNSLERERFIEELKGGDLWDSSINFLGNKSSIVEMFLIASS